MRLRLPLLALAAACAVPTVALAGDHADHGATDADGRHFGHHMPPQPDERRAEWEDRRAAWLDECRARMDRQDDWYDDGWGRKRSSGVTGAVLGGVAGGLAGRAIAGRGDRGIGTVAGAAVGAVAGAAIERASSGGHQRHERRSYSGDYCEQYFNYYTQQGMGYHGFGYMQPMMMVPVMTMHGHGHQHGRDCKETVVTEEWVTVRQPRRVRQIRVPDKRVRVMPDKRLPMK
jgi:hypothetical protein